MQKNMKSKVKITKLKGGSLSSTCLHESSSLSFVRKSIYLKNNREYGFQRWYSQLKKIQRFNVDFPNLFPKLLNYGLDKDYGFFDLEYIPNSSNLFDFLTKENDEKIIQKIFLKLKTSFDSLHKKKIQSFDGAIDLYYEEEIKQKISDCLNSKVFSLLIKNRKLFYNNEEIDGLCFHLDDYFKLFKKCYKNQRECLTHGNSTLENIIYDENHEQIIFIDPYEENIIDSMFADYSQVLQSSSSKYEYLNSLDISIKENHFNYEDNFPSGLIKFNDIFESYLSSFKESDILLIRLLEISQFIRMLPFKKEVDPNKMLFFYAHASFCYHNLRKNFKVIK